MDVFILPPPLPSPTERAGSGILVFGGTTEGRAAIEVLEEAGKEYYYSTKGTMQNVEMVNGVRLSGAMTAENIQSFCKENNIQCIINAAHPFAEGLHKAIADSDITTIRLERHFPEHINDITYLKDWKDAVDRIRCKRLLALSGVNTIAKLQEYWKNNDTIFRILNREESLEVVRKNGFPEDKLLFYPEAMPTIEEEKAIMLQCGCDAILTKESGDTGGFDNKVRAALELGINVYVVEHPALPDKWHYVTGKHTLRRAIQMLVPGFFPLNTGLTTGACATAATKAALLSLINKDEYSEVAFSLPDGEILTIDVENEGMGHAIATKDYSDDPDVLKGCRIHSHVEWRDDCDIVFKGGEGVGTVTLPGLGIAVGEPAINPTPRQMMTNEIRNLTNRGVTVTISVENGRELALKTFNHKVGVVDGISIIGTSGIVHPLSNDAFISSIKREMEVAWAIGCREIALVAGMKSENALRQEKDIRCIHYGNFIGEALKAAHDTGFRSVTIAIMIGKAVKLAEGHLDTHSHKVAMNKDFLKEMAQSLGIDATPINAITMARELIDIMPECFFERITELCQQHCQSVFNEGEIEIRLMK